MKTKVLIGLGGLLLQHPVMAQLSPIVLPQNGQGMMTGVSLGMQLEDSSGARLRFRTPGTTTGSNQAWSTSVFGPPSALHPDYSNSALFSGWTRYISGVANPPAWSALNPEHNPVLGDMSTGGDITPVVDANGVLNLGPTTNTAWYSLSFTVKAGTQGLPNSVFRQVAQSAGNVFSFTAPLSNSIRPELVDTVRFEYTRSQLGLTAAPTEITALDWGMGVISSGASGLPGMLQPVRTQLYFSLDRNWWLNYGSIQSGSGRVNKVVQVPGAQAFELDPSVVYRMDWSSGSWTVPVVAYDQTSLYGKSLAVGSNFGPAIDALSVDASTIPGNGWRVVFSLDAPSTLDGVPPTAEILVSQGGSSGQPQVNAKPLAARKTPSGPGIPVDNLIGIGPDELTGLCGRDPKEANLLDNTVGTPVPTTKDEDAVQSSLGVSLQRFDQTTVNDKVVGVASLLFEVTGIHVPANRFGYLVFEAELSQRPAGMQLVLPITFMPSVLPDYFPVPPGAQTQSLIVPTKNMPGFDFRLRANLVLLGGPTLEVQQSWVSTYAM
jgi:hypothetical protein